MYGTSFCIGPGVFLTAGHVLNNITSDGGLVTLLDLRVDQDTSVKWELAKDAEVVKSHDIGIIKCPMSALGLMGWETQRLPILADVFTYGYPYAVSKNEDPPAWRIGMRGFKGHIITRRQLWQLCSKAVGYEVACQFPTGLSGAPLLHESSEGVKVAGIILGQDQTQTGEDSDPTGIMRFGTAVDIASIASLGTKIVGGTLDQYRKSVLAAAESAKHT